MVEKQMIVKVVNVQQYQNISIAQIKTSESDSFNSEETSGSSLHLINISSILQKCESAAGKENLQNQTLFIIRK